VLIDASDPHLPQSTSTTSNVTASESSRWPGTEARIAFLGGTTNAGPEVGAGGYFSPHRSADGADFNAWAATMDLRLPIKKYFEVTANAYRGQALGGLGGVDMSITSIGTLVRSRWRRRWMTSADGLN